jgi:hypothetical protein
VPLRITGDIIDVFLAGDFLAGFADDWRSRRGHLIPVKSEPLSWSPHRSKLAANSQSPFPWWGGFPLEAEMIDLHLCDLCTRSSEIDKEINWTRAPVVPRAL